MRQVLAVLAIALAAIGLSIFLPHHQLKKYSTDTPDTSQKSTTKPAAKSTPSENWAPPREGAVTVVMTIKSLGDITMELYPKAAPKSVAEFIRLVKTGYYKNIKFHRVEPNFVVQAGDPESRHMESSSLTGKSSDEISAMGLGSGGTGKPIAFEDSHLQNLEGTVAFALKGERTDTADGQFFSNLTSNHNLDSNYCVLGRVTQGMDVVKRINIGDEITNTVTK